MSNRTALDTGDALLRPLAAHLSRTSLGEMSVIEAQTTSGVDSRWPSIRAAR
jgi:hypothetical protein